MKNINSEFVGREMNELIYRGHFADRIDKVLLIRTGGDDISFETPFDLEASQPCSSRHPSSSTEGIAKRIGL